MGIEHVKLEYDELKETTTKLTRRPREIALYVIQ